MVELKPEPALCVIGDIVASRRVDDRQWLHRHLEDALAAVNAVVTATEPLAVTVGDEFQGRYATLGAAIDACLRIRLLLQPSVDSRFGIGRGEVIPLDPARRLQDGPGWWAARAAITDVAARSRVGATRLVRTGYRSAAPDPCGPAVSAALDCRDHLVGSMPPRSHRLLRGLMIEGRTQAELADREGISASAVSQRVRSAGIGLILEVQQQLNGLP